MTTPPAGDGPTDLFLSLTPHKVIEAVEAAGVLCNPVCYPLNSFENRVYEVEREDRSRVVAKFYRPGPLAPGPDPGGAPLPRRARGGRGPRLRRRCPFPDGGTLAQVDNIAYCLFRRTGGRAPDELADELAERLGRLVARIHNVGAAGRAEHRMRLTADAYVRDEPRVARGRRARSRRASSAATSTPPKAIAEIADGACAGADAHRIHGDLHAGNLLCATACCTSSTSTT